MKVGNHSNPTRMELMKLKNKLSMTRRGHKLLKDKQDELIHQFVKIVHETKELRELVDNIMINLVDKFETVKRKRSLVNIYEMLMVPSSNLEVKYETSSIMAVVIPKIDLVENNLTNDKTFSDLSAPIEIDFIDKDIKSFLPKIILLAELEQKIRLMADEIEKVRRRVNVIEHVLVPEITEEIKSIRMKLDENERSNTVRIMKSKDIVVKKMLEDRAKNINK